MKRLQQERIAAISAYLNKTKLNPELFPEILDHLACEAEEQLWDGHSFEQAFGGIVETADREALLNLSVDHKHVLAMEKSLDDIVFEGRNKSYGAYDLRTGYGQTMQRSVLMGVTLFLSMFLLPDLYARLVPEHKETDIAYEVEMRPIDIKSEMLTKPIVPVEARKHVKSVRSLPPVVLLDDLVEIENHPPSIDELEDAQAGQETIAGIVDDRLIVPPSTGSGAEAASVVEVMPEEDITFTFVEQAPEYRGGIAAMSAFLQKNLRYPSPAAQAGVQGRVFVEFTVGADGKIEHVNAIKGIGFGCDEEAVRVVKLMDRWNPGKQAGVPVRVRFTWPIVFQLEQ